MEILNEFLTYIVPLAVAVGVGLIIGVERELRNKNAGLRTMMLVALGSASFVFLPAVLDEIDIATSELISMVVLSMGIISAAVIAKLGANANGLTTAASIWLVSLLGIMSAAGAYLLVGTITVLSLLVVWVIPFLEKLLGGKFDLQQIDITIKNKDEIEDEVLDILDELKIKTVKVSRTRVDTAERTVHILARLSPAQQKDLSEIVVNEKIILKFSV